MLKSQVKRLERTVETRIITRADKYFVPLSVAVCLWNYPFKALLYELLHIDRCVLERIKHKMYPTYRRDLLSYI